MARAVRRKLPAARNIASGRPQRSWWPERRASLRPRGRANGCVSKGRGVPYGTGVACPYRAVWQCAARTYRVTVRILARGRRPGRGNREHARRGLASPAGVGEGAARWPAGTHAHGRRSAASGWTPGRCQPPSGSARRQGAPSHVRLAAQPRVEEQRNSDGTAFRDPSSTIVLASSRISLGHSRLAASASGTSPAAAPASRWPQCSRPTMTR